MIEEYLRKDMKMYAAFMDLGNVYDRVGGEALKIYGVGGQLLVGINAFYRETVAFLRMDGESEVKGETKICDVATIFFFFLWMGV